MSFLTHDSQVKDAHQHGRECVRPFTGYSKRHLRRQAEAQARKQKQQQLKRAAITTLTETANGND